MCGIVSEVLPSSAVSLFIR